MTNEQRAAALRLAERLDGTWIARQHSDLVPTLRALAAEPVAERKPINMCLGCGDLPHPGFPCAEAQALREPVAEPVRNPDELSRQVDALRAENTALREELERKSNAIQRLWKERDELRGENAALREAAQAVIERWVNDRTALAGAIERLRAALEAGK